MKKQELVDAIARFINSEQAILRGETTLAQMLMTYFELLSIPADQKYDHWQIEPHIPRLVLDAIDAFENSDENWIVAIRSLYEQETGHYFENPVRLYSGDMLRNSMVADALSRIIARSTGSERLGEQVRVALDCERTMVQTRFKQFLGRVYVGSKLNDTITKSTHRGMSGTFGSTTLRTYVMAGRLMFTFARPHENGDDEYSISFVAEDEDPLALGAGLQSCHAPLKVALAMIDEVIALWDENSHAFEPSEKVLIA